MTSSNSTNSLTSASPPTTTNNTSQSSSSSNQPQTQPPQPQQQTYTSIIQNNGERPLTVVIKAPSPSPSVIASSTIVESASVASSQILAPPTITNVTPSVSPSLSLSKILPTNINIDSESVDSASDDSYFIEDDEDESWSEASDEEEEDENFDDTEEIVIVDDDFYEKNLENIPTQEQAQIIQKNINSDKVQFLHTVTVIPVTTSVPRLKRQLSSGMNRKRITKKSISNPTIPMEQFFKRLRVEQLIKYRRYHNIKTVTPASSREELEEATINHFKDEQDFVSEKAILSQLFHRLDTAIPSRRK